jgi:hypothetical protein
MFFRSHKSFEPECKIIETKDIRDILKLKHCTLGTFVALDLDNTIIEPEDEHQELGSDQWFVQFIEYASRVKADKQEAIALVITVYHAVQHHVGLKVVQPEIVRIIQILQDLEIPVIGLTARGSEIIVPTRRELKKGGIDFLNQWEPESAVLDIGAKGNLPVYKDGIIYCSGHPKDQCLKAFFDRVNIYPEKVLMVDDKEKYLTAVGKMVNQYGGSMVGLRYGFLDEKVKNHNLEEAQRKLAEIRGHLVDEAKEALVKLGL